jgi:radial spoke head protein 4A
LGTQKDYYIVEGSKDAPEEENPDPNAEKRGDGVNTNVYWVSNSVVDEWVELPDLKPKDLSDSRKIKMLFTGDLERDIITNPFFKAKEKNYLRAQIARISHATTLTPKGLYRSTEDNRIFMITIFSKGIRTMAK